MNGSAPTDFCFNVQLFSSGFGQAGEGMLEGVPCAISQLSCRQVQEPKPHKSQRRLLVQPLLTTPKEED